MTHGFHGGKVLLSHDGLLLCIAQEGDVDGSLGLLVNLHQSSVKKRKRDSHMTFESHIAQYDIMSHDGHMMDVHNLCNAIHETLYVHSSM